MHTISHLHSRRGLVLLGLLAAFMIPVLAASATAEAAAPKKAPPKAKAFDGPLSKAQKQRLEARARLVRSQVRRDAVSAQGPVTARDSVSVFCDPYQQASWGYWIKCHVVEVGGGSGYVDYYDYLYWTGTQWAFWFRASS